jgi:hypothetical protein
MVASAQQSHQRQPAVAGLLWPGRGQIGKNLRWGEHPIAFARQIADDMKAMKTICRKKSLTFGAFITAAHDAWGKRRAKGMVWLAVNARLVEFQGPQRFEFSKRSLN